MVQAANVNVGLNLESASFISGAEKSRRAMQQALGGIQADVSKTSLALQGATAAVGGFVQGLALTTGAGLSIAGIVGVATKAAREFAEAEQAQVKFASVLKATGGIAGVTSQEITKIADAMEATGTTTAEAVLDASAALGTFKNITGDTFTRAIKLTSDLSQVLGGDLTSNAVLLGKALTEPGEALEALRRKGVAFTDTQTELIKKLQETGQTAEAQKVILDALAARVGGAADAQGNTLTGSFNAANAALGNFLESLFAVSGAAESSQGALQGIIDILNQGQAALKQGGLPQLLFGKLATPSPLTEQLTIAQQKLAGLEQQLKESAFPGLLQQEANAAAAEVNRLADAIERAEHARASTTRAPAPTSTVERSLFQVAATPEDERAVNLTTQAFERAAEAEKNLADQRKATAESLASAAKTQAEAERRLAEQKADLIARLDEEVAASERLTEAIGKGAYAQELANIENDKQAKILELSKTLKGDELEHQKKKIELLAQEARIRASINTATPSGASVTQRQAERTSYEAYEKAAPDIAQKRIADEQKVADRLADIYAQPFKDLATNLANTLSEGIQDAISGEFDFATFAEGFGDIFADTLAASITAALTPALTSAAESFGDVLTSALKSSTAAGAGGTAAGPGLTWGGAALGGAAAGGIAGGLYGAYAPGMKPGNYAGIGGGIGGGLGGAAGFALTGGNPLGALAGAGIGSLLGSLTGGLFGGQNNLGNDRSAQQFRAGRGATYSDASFSAENRQVTQGIIDQLTSLQDALEQAGGAIADFGLRLEAGNKSGITVNGKKYPNAQAALAASLEVLIGSTTGLSASQQTVLQTTKAKDAQGIAADLDFAAQFDAMTFTGTALEAALKSLDGQMQQFARRAGELGLSVDAVAVAHQREAQALVDAQTAQQNQIKSAIQAIAPAGDQLELQLAQLNDGVQELARQALAAGLPLDDLAAAHQRAAANLVAANDQLKTSLLSEIEALAPSGNTLAIQLAQLNDRVQELARAATAAGLPLEQLAAAHQRAAEQLAAAAAQARVAVNLQVAQLNPASDPLDLKLQQLQAQVESLKPALDATGQTYDALAQAHQAAAKQIVADHHAAQRAEAESARAQRQAAEDAARQRKEQLAAQKSSVLQQIASLFGDNTLKTQLAQLSDQVKELARAAAEAGVPLRLVAQAHAAASKELARQAALAGRSVQLQIAQAGGDESLGTQLYALQIQMAELAKAAADAGISVNAVTRAHQLAAQELARQAALMGRSVQLQIAQAGGDKSLGTQLYGLQIQMEELAIAAGKVGIPLSEVTKAHKLAGAELERQFALTGRSVQLQIAQFGGDKSLGTQLYGLQIQMDELAKAATDVGIPLSEVTKAHIKAAENLRLAFEEQKQGVAAQIAQVGGSNTLGERLAALDVQMRQLGKAATEVGIPLSEVTAAHTKAAAAIRQEFEARKRALLAQVDELGQFGKPLDRALGALQTQVEELQRELIAAGLPIDKLAEAHKKAAQRIRDDWEQTLRDMRRQQREMTQGILEAQRSAAGAIDGFLNPFKEALSSRGIGQGVYSGAALTESGLKEFRETLQEARTGDTGALSSLVGIGQGAIAQARETYGSTTAFANIFREIEAGLKEQRDVLEDKREELLTQIGTFTRETVDEIIKLRVQAIGDLRADFAKLSRDIVVAVEGNA